MYKEVLKLRVSVVLVSLISYVKMVFVASKSKPAVDPKAKPNRL